MANFMQDDWEKFNSATHYYMYEKPFAPDNTQVRDCHLTGRYRGPVHSNCNINYKDSHCIPVVFHLSGYDAHFIHKRNNYSVWRISRLTSDDKGKISHSRKLFRRLKKNHKTCMLRFIDSYKFLNTSLDKLTLFLDKDKLRILQREFCNLSAEIFNLLTRKGIFPYEYIDCVKSWRTRVYRTNRFTILWPETLYPRIITAHTVNVWRRFSIRILGKYSDLYLKTDVLLLADIFENFRDTCIKSYGLDPSYYYTLPGFT